MKVFYFAMILLCFSAKASENEVMNLLNLEIKTIENTKIKNSLLYYRLVELYTERIELLSKNENTLFLKLTTSGKKIKKEDAFRQSRSEHRKLVSFGSKIIPKINDRTTKARIWHTLGLNERDYNTGKYTISYLKNALSYATEEEQRYHIQIDLAEQYYNEKKYKESHKYYEMALNEELRKEKDEWYAKHLFNWGWVQFKLNNHQKALTQIESSYHLSKTGKFIDTRDQALNSLIIIHSHLGQIDEIFDFIKANEQESFQYLFKVASKVADKGEYAITMKYIQRIKSKKLTNAQSIELIYLEAAQNENFHFEEKLFNNYKEIYSLLNKEEVQPLVAKMKYSSNRIQRKFQRGLDLADEKLITRNLTLSQSYLLLLAEIDKEQSIELKLMLAKNFTLAAEYQKSFDLYQLALDLLRDKKNMNLEKMALEEQLSIATEVKLKDNIEYYRQTYSRYINNITENSLHKEFREKLFKIYLDKNNISECRKIHLKYKENYPTEEDELTLMSKAIIEHYLQREDINEINTIVAETKKNKLYNISTQDLLKVESNLTHLLFKKLENLASEENYEQAILGQTQIYGDKKFETTIRIKAARNLIHLYAKKQDAYQTNRWFDKTNELLTKGSHDQEKQEIKQLMIMSANLFIKKQNFISALQVLEHNLHTYCRDQDKLNDSLYENILRYSYIQNLNFKILPLMTKNKKCVSSSFNETEINNYLLNELYSMNQFEYFIQIAKRSKVEDKNLINSLWLDFWLIPNQYQKEIRLILKSHNRDAGLDQLEQLSFEIHSMQKELISNLPNYAEFNMEDFNLKLAAKLQAIKTLESTLASIYKIKHPYAIYKNQVLFEKIVTTLKNEVQNYILPENEDADFKKAFYKEMQKIASKLTDKINASNKALTTLIVENNTLIRPEMDNYLMEKNILPASLLSLHMDIQQ
jgi:hypothetical protein